MKNTEDRNADAPTAPDEPMEQMGIVKPPLLSRRAILASAALGASAMLMSPTTALAAEGPLFSNYEYSDAGGMSWQSTYHPDEGVAHEFHVERGLCELSGDGNSFSKLSYSYTRTPLIEWGRNWGGTGAGNWLGISMKVVARCDFCTPTHYHIVLAPYVAGCCIVREGTSTGWISSDSEDSRYYMYMKDGNGADTVVGSSGFDINCMDNPAPDWAGNYCVATYEQYYGEYDGLNRWVHWTDYEQFGAFFDCWVRRGADSRNLWFWVDADIWQIWDYNSHPNHHIWIFGGAGGVRQVANGMTFSRNSGASKASGGMEWDFRILNITRPNDGTMCLFAGDGKNLCPAGQATYLWPAPEQLNLQWATCSDTEGTTDPHAWTGKEMSRRWHEGISFANAMQEAHGQDARWLNQQGGGPTTVEGLTAQIWLGDGTSASQFMVKSAPEGYQCVISDCDGHYLNSINDLDTTGNGVQFWNNGWDAASGDSYGSRWKLTDCWHLRREGNKRGGDAGEAAFRLSAENLVLKSSDQETDRRTATWNSASSNADKAQISIPTKIRACTYPYSWNDDSLPNSAYSIVWHEVMKKPDGTFYDPAYLNGKIAVWCRSYHGSEFGRLAAEQPTQNCAGLPGRHTLNSFRLRLQNETGLSGSLVYQKANATEELPDIDDWDNPLAADTAALTTAEGAGYESDSSNIACIRCKLTGELAEAFDVSYICYIGNTVQKWSSWVQNGEWTARNANGLVDAICIRIEPKWYKEADVIGFRPLSSSSTQTTLTIKDVAPTKDNPRAFVLCTSLDLPNSSTTQLSRDLRYLGHAASEMIVVTTSDDKDTPEKEECTVRFYADGEAKPKYSSDKLVSDGSRYSFPDAAATACAKTGCRLDKWYSDPDYTKEIAYVTLPKDKDGTIDVYTRNICTVAFDLTNSAKKHLASNTPYADEAMTATADQALMKPADMDTVYYGTRLYPSMCDWTGRLTEAYIEAGAGATAHKITVRDGFYTDPAASSAFSSQGITITSSATLYVDWPRATFDGYEAS